VRRPERAAKRRFEKVEPASHEPVSQDPYLHSLRGTPEQQTVYMIAGMLRERR
jgi:hypothetical protein